MRLLQSFACMVSPWYVSLDKTVSISILVIEHSHTIVIIGRTQCTGSCAWLFSIFLLSSTQRLWHVNIDIFQITSTKTFWLEMSIFGESLDIWLWGCTWVPPPCSDEKINRILNSTSNTTEKRKSWRLQLGCSIQKVWKVKPVDVIAYYNIRIDLVMRSLLASPLIHVLDFSLLPYLK